MNSEFLSEIVEFKPKLSEPLGPFTTWKIGGPADVLIELDDSQKLIELITLAIRYNLPYTILGNGSNVLISDNGIAGLVIINHSKNIQILEKNSENYTISGIDEGQFNPYIQPRHIENSGEQEYYSFSDLDYVETGERLKVKFDSGVTIPYAIAWSLKNNLTGLQWFAGIPGTIGGALYNNIHGGTKHFSDNFYSATVFDPETKKTKEYYFNDFHFGYDQSLLRENKKLVVVDVTLSLFKGDTEKAKYVANEWTKRKRIQPRLSCGSVFQCITLEQQKTLSYPTPSAGYITDKILGMKGQKQGNVWVSDKHANFIENLGDGKASDVLFLMHEIKNKAKEKSGVNLIPEINLLGFSVDEVGDLYNQN